MHKCRTMLNPVCAKFDITIFHRN